MSGIGSQAFCIQSMYKAMGKLLSVHHIKWKRLSEMHKYIFLDLEVIIMSCALAGTFSIVQHLVHYCISRCLVVWYKSLKWIKWYISQTIIKNIVYAPTAATTQSSAEPFSLTSQPAHMDLGITMYWQLLHWEADTRVNDSSLLSVPGTQLVDYSCKEITMGVG